MQRALRLGAQVAVGVRHRVRARRRGPGDIGVDGEPQAGLVRDCGGVVQRGDESGGAVGAVGGGLGGAVGAVDPLDVDPDAADLGLGQRHEQQQQRQNQQHHGRQHLGPGSVGWLLHGRPVVALGWGGVTAALQQRRGGESGVWW